MNKQNTLEREIRGIVEEAGLELLKKKRRAKCTHPKFQLINPATGDTRLMVIPSTVGRGRAYQNNVSLARRLCRELS